MPMIWPAVFVAEGRRFYKGETLAPHLRRRAHDARHGTRCQASQWVFLLQYSAGPVGIFRITAFSRDQGYSDRVSWSVVSSKDPDLAFMIESPISSGLSKGAITSPR